MATRTQDKSSIDAFYDGIERGRRLTNSIEKTASESGRRLLNDYEALRDTTERTKNIMENDLLRPSALEASLSTNKLTNAKNEFGLDSLARTGDLEIANSIAKLRRDTQRSDQAFRIADRTFPYDIEADVYGARKTLLDNQLGYGIASATRDNTFNTRLVESDIAEIDARTNRFKSQRENSFNAKYGSQIEQLMYKKLTSEGSALDRTANNNAVKTEKNRISAIMIGKTPEEITQLADDIMINGTEIQQLALGSLFSKTRELSTEGQNTQSVFSQLSGRIKDLQQMIGKAKDDPELTKVLMEQLRRTVAAYNNSVGGQPSPLPPSNPTQENDPTPSDSSGVQWPNTNLIALREALKSQLSVGQTVGIQTIGGVQRFVIENSIGAPNTRYLNVDDVIRIVERAPQ
jgi:hypothetical protein